MVVPLADRLRGRPLLRMAALVAAAAALCLVPLYLTIGPTHPFSRQTVIVQIPAGWSTRQIAGELRSAGLVRSSRGFQLWAVVTGQASALKAGEYRFGYAMSIPGIVGRIARGQVVLHPVTVPEGYTIRQIGELLAAKGFADPRRFEAAIDAAAGQGAIPDAWLPRRKPVLRELLEGYLFPDTYSLYRGISEAEIVRAMLSRFKTTFGPAFEARAAELGMAVANVLALASIIEKEARAPEERTVISGVFHNRLRIGMKLESCATVRYVMKDPHAPITEREMAIDSPFNTYVYYGLPPGPICSPGLASIQAALYPGQVDYLYFVAKPDGTHAFARTFAEHQQNIRKYLQQ